MTNNILQLGAKALQFLIENAPDSGVIALDQAAAFLTLSRKYLMYVLHNMNMERRLRVAIKMLLLPSQGRISIVGRVFGSILLSGAVKQGCPAAMVLFIFGFDPIIRWISGLIAPHDLHLGAYCDDVGLVVRRMSVVWSILARVFALVTKFSSLHLNVSETQILIIYSIDRSALELELEQISPAVCESFTRALKYLGV